MFFVSLYDSVVPSFTVFCYVTFSLYNCKLLFLMLNVIYLIFCQFDIQMYCCLVNVEVGISLYL